MARVLLVVGEEEIRGEMARLLERLGHEVLQSPGPPDCYSVLTGRRPQVLVAEESEEVLSESLRLAPSLPVVLCLRKRDAAQAVSWLKRGAFECVAPPWTGEALAAPIRRAARLQGPELGVSWFERTPRRRLSWMALWIVLPSAVFALIALSILRSGGRREAAIQSASSFSKPLPYHHPAGAYWRDGLWVSDWFNQSVYHHSPELEVLKVLHFTDATPGPFTFAEGALLVSVGPKWLKAVPDAELRREGSWPAPGPRTVGLCYDGLYLWSLDAAENKLRKHLLDDRMSVIGSFAYPGKGAAALACGADGIWSLDETGQLLQHDSNRPDLVLAKSSLPQFASGVWKPTGLAREGGYFWSVGEKKDGEDGRVFRDPDPWGKP
jgi:hypothetical protein